MLPIPKNLQDIIELQGEKNTQFKVYGNLKCTCKNQDFEILYVGDDTNYKKEKIIKVTEIDGTCYLIVKAACKKCNKIYKLFDADYNGWNGFVCEGFGGRVNSRPKYKKWSCVNCENVAHKVSITIYSKGKQDFIEETEGAFNEDDWVEGYSWIGFEIECANCGLRNKKWTSCETM